MKTQDQMVVAMQELLEYGDSYIRVVDDATAYILDNSVTSSPEEAQKALALLRGLADVRQALEHLSDSEQPPRAEPENTK